MRFESDLLENLFNLAQEVQQGIYQPSRSVCFVTTTPKCREIFAADFKDRVVHHLLVRELEKIWEPWFVFDSYASRKDKGIHSAVKRLGKFMNQSSCSRKKKAWFLQMDIRSFFMSIDKDILFRILEKGIQKKMHPMADALLYLLHRIVFHDCTRDYYFKGDKKKRDMVPAHKSLFKVETGMGLPIGNLTSQFFANVYLNELDQYIKHDLKCRYYIRYVDDFILVSENRERLVEWRKKIDFFLRSSLLLTLKQDKGPIPVSNGADFLGYIVRPDYLLVRNRVVGNLKLKIILFKNILVKETRLDHCRVAVFNMDDQLVQNLFQTIASYMGHFKHASSFRLVTELMKKNDWLNEYFYFSKGRIHKKYNIKKVFLSVRAQHAYFRSLFKDSIIFFKVGKFYEFYGNDALSAGSLLKLRVMENHRRKIKYMSGFPVAMVNQYCKKMLSQGKDVVVINETHRAGHFIRERSIKNLYRIMPCEERAAA
ncbi:MAG: hypothetical protein K8S13_13700 [Desulfobacula sp.]|nr:hypothetical protein [Desulfobacula sp.]